jgi:hypothetical protein
MSFSIKSDKLKPVSEEETRTKFLAVAYNIGCYKEVNNLLKKTASLSERYKYNPIARIQVVEDLILNLAKIDERLVGWLLDENMEIKVNGKVVLKLMDDGLPSLY